MSEHTELPWHKDSDIFDPSAVHIFSEAGNPIIWGSGFSTNFGDKKANAAFIVKAVNNHYQLLEALKTAGDELAFIVNHVGLEGAYDRVELITEETRKAIKEAE